MLRNTKDRRGGAAKGNRTRQVNCTFKIRGYAVDVDDPRGGANKEPYISGRRKLALLLLCIFAGSSILLSGVALASTKYQGRDYSYGFEYNQRVKVCDKESDWRQAYAEHKRFGSKKIRYTYDSNGARRGCGNSGYFVRGISHHKTCEDVAGIPDPCNWRWSKHRR